MKNIVKCFFTVLFSTIIICECFANEINILFSAQNVQDSTGGIVDIIDKTEQECISKTANTFEMNRCSQVAQQSWERDIKKNLAELKKILNTESYKKLQLSQISWEYYKKNDYKLIDSLISHKQGTMYLNFREGWKTEIVKQRALILREYLNTVKEEY